MATNGEQKERAKEATRPVRTFRVRGISASVFENESTEPTRGPWYRVSLQRTYRDEAGNFKTTSSFGRDDIPVARHVLEKAWEFILKVEMAARSNTETAGS